MTETININNGAFLFKREANFIEIQKIESMKADILGGTEKLLELENLRIELYRKHIKHNQELFGDKFEEIQEASNTPLTELHEETKKNVRLFYDNKYYRQCVIVVNQISDVSEIAELSVLCIKKPEGYDFLKQKPEDLREIIRQVKKEKEFFRKGDGGTKADN